MDFSKNFIHFIKSISSYHITIIQEQKWPNEMSLNGNFKYFFGCL